MVGAAGRAWCEPQVCRIAIEFSLPPRCLWGKGRGWGAAHHPAPPWTQLTALRSPPPPRSWGRGGGGGGGGGAAAHHPAPPWTQLTGLRSPPLPRSWGRG